MERADVRSNIFSSVSRQRYASTEKTGKYRITKLYYSYTRNPSLLSVNSSVII